MVLESNQFNQLVEEVKKALLVGSQGVGDVEIVDSLADIVSLPALRLAGMVQSVVEAPLELLSAPAEEAAEEVRKAEAERVIVENARKEAEKSRETAETKRASSESTRASAETTRINAEKERVTAEGLRKTAETERGKAEAVRQTSETGRATAEDFSVVCRELRPMFAVKPFECRGAGRVSVVKVFLTTARKRALFLARKTSFSLPAISRI